MNSKLISSLFALVLLLPSVVFSQTYQELNDTKPFDTQAVWEQSLKTDFDFVWGKTDIRYPKFSVPNKKAMLNEDGNSRKMILHAWRGEKVNAQAIIYTKVDLEGFNLSVSDLTSGKNKIEASAINIHPIGYIITDEINKDGKTGCGKRPDRTLFDSTLVADVLHNEHRNLSIPAYSTRPVWINIAVPQDVKAGTYRGLLSLETNTKTQTLNIEVRVNQHQLPAASEWTYHLDLWQNPYSVARYHDVELWSQEHFDLMKPLMKLLADAGQKVITTTLMHKPWGGQTYDHFESMITRIKNLDGSWEYRYDVFDKWVHFMMDEIGIDKQIDCYSLIPWSMTFDYYDQASNTVRYIKTTTDSPEYTNYWLPFLKDFARHLKAKGWFEKTTIAMDERSMQDMQNGIALIKQADPDFKISLAGKYHPEIEEYLYDYCIAFRWEFPKDVMARRKSEGKLSTVYTCCKEPFPNTFTFSPPAEATWLAWHAAARDYDGYLRWAYNSWTEAPLLDTRFITWAAGDCYLVYPEARSSIRFEKLKEGIQDYEKIKILKNKYANSPKKLSKLLELIDGFTMETKGNQSTEKQVRDARRILNSL